MSLTIKLDAEETVKKANVSCHMLPCGIKLNGFCKVSKYFTPYTREVENIQTNSIRGYPLQGQKVKVPTGYSGYTFREIKSPNSEDRELKATGVFNEFTAWNWDKKPSADDKLIGALQWVSVASILHKPLSECDDQESGKSPQKTRKRKLSE